MSVSTIMPTRSTYLRLVKNFSPNLLGSTPCDIGKITADKQMRRMRMDQEDRANAIQLPIKL